MILPALLNLINFGKKMSLIALVMGPVIMIIGTISNLTGYHRSYALQELGFNFIKTGATFSAIYLVLGIVAKQLRLI